MTTLIAEDLLLLLLDDDKGTLAAASNAQPLLGGALLVELALAERIEIGEKTSVWSSAKVRAADGPPPEDPLLVAALATVEQKPRAAVDLVNRIGRGTKDELLRRLEGRGLVRRSQGTVLGLFPRTTWPAADRSHEAAVRDLLQGVLVHGLTPDPRTAALVGLLHSVDQAHQVVDRGALSAKDVKRRAQEVGDGGWAAKAVKDAIVAAQTAVTAAVAASAAATAAGSS